MNHETIFDRFQALTFDDVVVIPGYSHVLPADVDTSATFAGDIRLAVPLVSAAMDKVTESGLAIAIARRGGIGVIHRNLSIEEQAREVDRVKRSQSGMITDPVTLRPTATVGDAEQMMAAFHISGVPITDGDGRLVGILTNRDTRFMEPGDLDRPVSDFMTAQGLITASATTTLAQAKAILRVHRIEKLPLVDADGRLVGLITVKDINKHTDNPFATQDSLGRLRVAAAVGVGPDLEARVEALFDNFVDAIVIDTAHGHSAGVVEAIKRIKAVAPVLVVAGNVVTAEGVEALFHAGADAIKVGVGAGSICTTRIIAGAGMPQLSAVYESSVAARRLGVPLIADGGTRFSGDVVKAIAAGAHTVMLGSLLAGTDEAPGETELFEGRRYKSYRGMGSLGAMQGHGADRYGSAQGGSPQGGNAQGGSAQGGSAQGGSAQGGSAQGGSAQGGSARSNKAVPEGIEGRVPHAGSAADVIDQLVGGLRSGMGYAGAADLEELRTASRFMRVTTAGRDESHPHDVEITRAAPNYQVGMR